MRKSYFPFLLFFLHLLTLTLKAENVFFRHIGERDGLKYTWVNHIHKDSRGYMWFSTIYGAYRYDSYNFKEYAFRSEDGKLLRVNFVFEDSSTNLWFGTESGLFRYNPHNGQREHFSKDRQSLYRLSSNFIEDMDEDAEGNLWIAGIGGVDVIRTDGSLKSWQVGHASTLEIDSRGNVWTAVGRTVLCLSYNGDDFQQLDLPVNVPGTILDIFQDSSNDFWISTSNGLLQYRLPKKTVTIFNEASGTLTNNLVRMVRQDNSGNLWVATEHGITRISEGETSFVVGDDSNVHGLNDNAIYSIYCDDSGNIWVGTFFGGINVSYSQFKMFDFLLTSSEEFSASSKVISCISNIDGNLCICTENDGIYFVEEEGQFRHLSAGINGLRSDNIHAICNDRYGNLWIGSYYGGLYLKQPGSSTFRNFRVNNSPELRSNNIYCILNDSNGNLWVGTQSGGLYRYDYNSASLKQITDIPSNLFIWDLFEDSTGDIWLACYGNRIWKLQVADDYRPYPVESPASTYVSICELSDGRIAFTTESEGIILLNPATYSIENVSTRNGLPDDTVYAMLQDDSNDVWFSTNSGICRTDPSFKSFTTYTIRDGLPTCRFNYNSHLKQGGKLYFGSTNGLVIVDPSREIKVDINRKIRFNNLYINNIIQEISSEGPLSLDINEIGLLKLKHWQNSVSLDFSTDLYGHYYGRSYAYRMTGLDDEWHFIQYGNRVDFVGLSPGHYTLSVANTSDNEILDNISTLKIYIKPVWWQSTAARITTIILLVALSVWLVNMLFQSSRHKHELTIEKLQREKDKEITEMKLRFFVNISHEFKTPLSLILGPVEQFMNSRVPKDKTSKYFSIIRKNADKLLGLINELLAFRELQFTDLKYSSFNVKEIIQNVLSRYEWLFEDKEIALYCDIPDQIRINADKGKFEKILDNILSNAYKHCSKKDSVNISVSERDRMVYFEVLDTGEGIPADNLPHIFDRFFTGRSYDMYSSGVGLSYVKSLVELHGGSIEAESEHGRYTVLRFSLPKDPVPSVHTPSTNEEYTNESHFASLLEKPVEPDFDKEEYLKLASDTVVLIVEDDSSMRDLLIDHFSRRYQVMSADSAEAAARQVRENKVDVVISDVMLHGGMSGFDLCSLVKNQIETCHIKVVLMTVLSEQNYKCQGYLAGADAYIVKPFTFSLLELMVKNLVVNAYVNRENFRKIEIDLSSINIPSSNSDEQLLKKVSAVILSNISESDFGIEDLCLQVGMSKASLYRKLKALTGQSTNEFLQNFRLKYAARLLTESDRPISDIAYDVGFSDPYYFSRAFKKLFEMSPKQWRQEHSGENPKN